MDIEFLTSPEVAAVLRCTRRTVDAMATRGDGPPYIIAGNRRLYPTVEFKAWKAANLRRSTAEAS